MRYEYDPDVDALYIHLNPEGKPYDHSFDLDPECCVDYARDGLPIGIELPCVSSGVKLDGLPERERIKWLLSELRVLCYERSDTVSRSRCRDVFNLLSIKGTISGATSQHF